MRNHEIEMPDQNTEIQELDNEPIDKKEAERLAALDRENKEWRRNRPKKWEYWKLLKPLAF